MVSYCGLVEPVFKALSDQTRRELLDELFRRDGQTLNALASRFDMTRVAVAKHLRLLEAAGLVVSRRSGREKLHYLNPVPIRLVHDRWVSKYTEGWAAGLADLKRDMETTVEKVFEIYIRTTPEQLWRAITDPGVRARYQFGAHVESSWTAGSTYRVSHPGAPRPLIEGENLEVDPPRRLVQAYRAVWDDDVAAEGTSRVTWEI
jgi:DNA-binding transcriptional ArsR family regulator